MNKFTDTHRWISVGLVALALILSSLPSQAAKTEKTVPRNHSLQDDSRRLPALPPLPRVDSPTQNAIAPETPQPSRSLPPLPRVRQPRDRTKILPKPQRKVLTRQNTQLESTTRRLRSLPSSPTTQLKTQPASLENRQITQNPAVRRRYINPAVSYIGLGGNVGLSNNGVTDLGKGSVAIDAKIALTDYLSVRPAVLIGDSTTFLLPLTYDINIQGSDPFKPAVVHPFIGGGLTLATKETELNNNVAPLATAGIDFRVSDRVVVYSNVSAGFFGEQTEVGARFGIGYVFSGTKK
ncbi:MAG: hypothetical protein J7647_09685 [Cyanobacteria bacterium SBLK]|nr:hypothetical protein [Cyanobacteria bacterium SBLK]